MPVRSIVKGQDLTQWCWIQWKHRNRGNLLGESEGFDRWIPGNVGGPVNDILEMATSVLSQHDMMPSIQMHSNGKYLGVAAQFFYSHNMYLFLS